jgi:hypothetical protein
MKRNEVSYEYGTSGSWNAGLPALVLTEIVGPETLISMLRSVSLEAE